MKRNIYELVASGGPLKFHIYYRLHFLTRWWVQNGLQLKVEHLLPFLMCFLLLI